MDSFHYYHDPLKCPLPRAPSMNMYNLYGVNKPVERSYHYLNILGPKVKTLNPPSVAAAALCSPLTFQPLWVVQPDAVCEVSWSFIGGPGDVSLGRPNKEIVHQRETKGHTGDAPSNQPIVAGVSPHGNVGTLKQTSLSLSAHSNTIGLLLNRLWQCSPYALIKDVCR